MHVVIVDIPYGRCGTPPDGLQKWKVIIRTSEAAEQEMWLWEEASM